MSESTAAVEAWLAGERVGAAWISDPVSIAYLTGFRTDPHERLMGLALGRGGPVLVVPDLERESAEQATHGVEVVGWRDGQDPYQLAAGALGGADRLAVEKSHLTLAVAERLQAATGTASVVDVGPLVRGLRVRKRPEEIRDLERAAALTDAVADRLIASLRTGETELEVASRLNTMLFESGATLSFETIVQSGPNSAQPHLRPGARRLAEGDLVLLDFGGAVGGYRADLTRTVAIGEPDPRLREVHRVVVAANRAAVAAVRPGATAGEVDEAARRVIRDAGFDEYFIHRVGHGLGLDAHEDPSLDPGSPVRLEVGMVFTVEPGVYIPGLGGVRIEDDLVVEESGARELTSCARDLRVVSPR